MTSTTIRPNDRLVVTTDASPAARRPVSRRTAAAVLVGVVAVSAAGVSYAVSRLSVAEPSTSTSAQIQGFGDKSESVHGTRAGLGTGTGLPLTVGITGADGRETVVIAHGLPGSISTTDGQRIKEILRSAR